MRVPIRLMRLLSSDYPGFVQAELVDAAGTVHRISEKIPVLFAEDVDFDTQFPIDSTIQCEIVGAGREPGVATVELSAHVESDEGLTRFRVKTEDLTE